MSTTPKQPSHKIYAVTKGAKKNFWQEIGAAWPHSDGKGFSLRLDFLPINGAEISLREPRTEVAEERGAL
jgi:hypothetical protein